MFVKKWSLEYQKVIKTDLCTYLQDSSDSSYSSDSNYSSDSSDQTTLYTKHRKNREKLPWELVGCQGVEVIKKIVTKLKNSNCEKKTKKLNLWQKSKNLIVTKLKNSNCEL